MDLLAYFLTFRCYGTWLHGDARGSVDRKNNVPGTPLVPPMPTRERRERAMMSFPPMVFDPAHRGLVEDSFRATCNHREWELLAVNARTNHVHAVVTADGWAPEEVMRVLKAWATRRLREAGLVPRRHPVWSHHGSTVYLWTPEQLESAVWYVVEGQDKRPQE